MKLRETREQDRLEITVVKRRLRWLDRVQYMNDSRRAKHAVHWISDKKDTVRPRITRKVSEIELMDTTWEDVFLKALEREEWKE